MPGYNPDIHKRRSIRLKDYDYSQDGVYFITICAHEREHLFGHIENDKMILNAAGIMIKKWYMELENKFTGIKCHEFIIMPNHFHCIVVNVGADLCVRPDNNETDGQTHRSAPTTATSLSTVVQWFKTMTTNEYIKGATGHNWKPFNKKLWQRNYYEHIIRNRTSYQTISDYILNNPARWLEDKFYS